MFNHASFVWLTTCCLWLCVCGASVKMQVVERYLGSCLIHLFLTFKKLLIDIFNSGVSVWKLRSHSAVSLEQA